MTVASPEPGPEERQPPVGSGGSGWAWVDGGAGAGPVPDCEPTAPESASPAVADLPAGLDYQALLDGLAASGVLDAEDQDAALAERLEAEDEGRLGPCDPARAAALAVEHMDPGPAQAGWLGVADAARDRLGENELAGVAIAARQLASWAQASELAAVAQITSRAAGADPKIGVAADGRPGRVCRDALGQVALALSLSHYGAGAWADLAVTLAWRLPATGAALAAGRIDLYRARLIAESTSVLGEEAARAVELRVLPDAGARTAADLRARLRRAVIAADPAGAERRRQDAERQARVSLYADDDHTATLTGSKLPAVQAAAAMARITAMARAMRAAGQPGGLDLHRAQVMLGLLLGTLPFIPPAEGAPPDQPPPGGDDPGGPSDNDSGGLAGVPAHDPANGGPGPGVPAYDPADGGPGPGVPAYDPADGSPGPGVPAYDPANGGPGAGFPAADGPGDAPPPPRDEDAPEDDGLDGVAPGDDGLDGDAPAWDPADDDPAGTGLPPAWPALGVIPPALARRPGQPGDGRPVPGLLDAVVPWTTLAGLCEAPGALGRIGPLTAAQARLLARAAETDPAAQWRVIVTNGAGQAIAVARIRRRARAGPAPPRDGRVAARDGRARDGRASDGPARDGPSPGTGLVGRMTVTIGQDLVTEWQRGASAVVSRRRGASGAVARRRRGASGPGPPGGIVAAALRTAAGALDGALAAARADAAAGGCAHHAESPAYRPPPRLREYVIARDLTCRSPVCRQPAWRADLDHTLPWQPGNAGGRTCSCNLGGGCRRDHQLKQHPRWKLEQSRPGFFTWITPAGRSYTVGPDVHPV